MLIREPEIYKYNFYLISAHNFTFIHLFTHDVLLQYNNKLERSQYILYQKRFQVI